MVILNRCIIPFFLNCFYKKSIDPLNFEHWLIKHSILMYHCCHSNDWIGHTIPALKTHYSSINLKSKVNHHRSFIVYVPPQDWSNGENPFLYIAFPSFRLLLWPTHHFNNTLTHSACLCYNAQSNEVRHTHNTSSEILLISPFSFSLSPQTK